LCAAAIIRSNKIETVPVLKTVQMYKMSFIYD